MSTAADRFKAKDTHRARWVVPVGVALIAASTVVAAMQPGPFFRSSRTAGVDGPAFDSANAARTTDPGNSPPSPEPIRSMWLDQLSGGMNVDLPASNDTQPDLRIYQGALNAPRPATFAVLGSGHPSTRLACEALDGVTQLTELRISELTPGVRLCVRTSAGHVALVVLNHVHVGTVSDGSSVAHVGITVMA